MKSHEENISNCALEIHEQNSKDLFKNLLMKSQEENISNHGLEIHEPNSKDLCNNFLRKSQKKRYKQLWTSDSRTEIKGFIKKIVLMKSQEENISNYGLEIHEQKSKDLFKKKP